jgi:low affinity Fe/Cu permease
MAKKKPTLSKFLNWSAKKVGKPITFVLALLLVAVWIVIGMIWGFNNTWLLILNTIATLNAALMVFIIQNSQSRETKALHLKIDELIRVTKEATNELIAIEELEEEEQERIKKKIFPRKKDKDGPLVGSKSGSK